MLKFNKLQPTQYVVLGFFLVILTGSILLVLPFMHMKVLTSVILMPYLQPQVPLV